MLLKVTTPATADTVVVPDREPPLDTTPTEGWTW
jgi:hypothetical protein